MRMDLFCKLIWLLDELLLTKHMNRDTLDKSDSVSALTGPDKDCAKQ